MSHPRPLLIAGPTASGKSALALALAERDRGMVINADALQVYDCWRVLTARPSAAEVARAPHRLYGHVPATEVHSTGRWLREIRAVLAEARETGHRLIIVGGSGLLFSALTQGLANIPETPPALRAEGTALMQTRGREWFVEALSRDDPQTLSRIDAQNPVRLQRAWEVLRLTGRGLSDWQAETPPPTLALEDCTAMALLPRVDWLDARIARRFTAMMETGALDEVRAWTAQGYPDTLPAAKALGRAELCAYLAGDMTREAAIAGAVQASRRYAKRQRTWLRNRMSDWRMLDPALPLDTLIAQARP